MNRPKSLTGDGIPQLRTTALERRFFTCGEIAPLSLPVLLRLRRNRSSYIAGPSLLARVAPVLLRRGLAAAWLAAGLLTASTVFAEITPATRWADPSHVTLAVEFPGEGYHADWELFRCDCGDLLVRSELNVPGDVEQGESLLVSGRAVLSRGFAGAAELGSSLDAPALMMQLALRLLERAAPGGPAAIGEAEEIELNEDVSPILLESYSAMGGFQAPWSLRGSISPAGPSGRRFDLRFEFTAGGGDDAQHGSMRLRGTAEFAEGEFPVPGTTGLEDWTLTWRDEKDAAAGKAPDEATLDGLRALIKSTIPD